MPVSRSVGGILFPGALRLTGSVTIHLCGLPEGAPANRGGRAARALCLALLRVGVTQPPVSPPTLVRSYRTVSPLPVRPEGRHRRSALCCPVPSDRSNLALASTLPCGVPTFLDPCNPRHRGHPADSPARPVSHRSAHRTAGGPTSCWAPSPHSTVARSRTGPRGAGWGTGLGLGIGLVGWAWLLL